MTPKNTFFVFGNHGQLTVDATTGIVRAYDYSNADSDAYNIIDRFDVVEWNCEYPNETLAGQHVDILDIGYWFEDENGATGYEFAQRDRSAKAQQALLLKAVDNAIELLGDWLTDNTTYAFEEQPEIDNVRNILDEAQRAFRSNQSA